MVKFLVVAGITVAVTVLLSYTWPRFTTQARPAPLAKVYDVVAASSFGPKIENVLGVSSSGAPPVSVSAIAQGAAQSATTAVQAYMTKIVFHEATRQLVNQMNNLSPDQRDELKQLICSPPPSSPSASAP